MALEHEEYVANVADVSSTSPFNTSTESQSQHYTNVEEPTPNNASTNVRALPKELKEYQSEDIKDLKRVKGQATIIGVEGQETKIGEGGQAKIYEVIVDTGLEHGGRNPEYRTFAAKLFQGQFNDSRFGQWQEQANGLGDYYGGFICQFYGYCKNYKGSFCLLMHKYDCSLRNNIDQEMMKNNNNGRPFKSGVALNMICQIAVGMAIVHKENILHRDLKADNVFVYKDASDNMPWGAYIGDFDISDTTMGSAYWRAPEILEATEKRKVDINTKVPWTPMADVYSFGMTCYEILTGDIPLKDHPRSDYEKVCKGGIRPILPTDLNPMIKKLIVRCWHQDPLKRPTFNAIVSELKEILKEFHMLLEIFDKIEKLPPLKARPSTTECLLRLEHVFQDLRSKYPIELFIQQDEVDFVKLAFHFLKCMKRFVRKFGYKPYIDHPSLPWSMWYARFKWIEKLMRLTVELDHALPYFKEKKIITILKKYIFDAICEGKEVCDSCIAEEGISEIQKEAKWRSWLENVKKRPPLLDRHIGCIQKNNYGHYGGDKDYPICDFCKDEKPVVENAKKPSTFRLFDDKFASDTGWKHDKIYKKCSLVHLIKMEKKWAKFCQKWKKSV